MRTLKKTLCLVLALVLCFGLVGTAFAANYDKYTDADKVGAVYAEAVDVLLGTGIVNGMSATELGATGTFTREQAAKIVTYMLVGGKIADALKADVAPFDDVAATRWSAGYIAYCVNAGIIKGYGNGNFGPTDDLTGLQFAAMLLRAVGLGKNGEYEGSGWYINVATDALALGLFKGDESAAVNEPIQRQQAMLMAFNGLNYTTKAGTYNYVVKDSADKVIYQGTDALTALVMYQSATGNTLALVESLDGSLGDTVYGLQKSSATDAFGRESVTYINKNNPKQVYASIAPEAVFTQVGSITEGQLAAKLGCTLVADKVNITKIVDGVAGTAYDINKTMTNVIGDVGSTIEVYKNADGTYDVVVIYVYMKALAATDIEKAVPATPGTDAVPAYIKLDSGYTFETDAFKAGDVVLYNKGKVGTADVALNVVKANAFTGKITKYVSGQTVTVGGTTYKVDNFYFSVPGTDTFTKDYVFYCDNNNIVYKWSDVTAAPVAPYDGYLYVVNTQVAFNGGSGSDLFKDAVASAAAARATVVTTAGEAKVVDLAIIAETTGGTTNYFYMNTAGIKTAITASDTAPVAAGVWVGYNVADGKYTFGAAETLTTTAAYNKANVIESKYATSTTAYTYINTADKKVSTVTGYQNIVLASGVTALVLYADAAKTTIKELYVVKTTPDVVPITAVYAYAAQAGATVAGGQEYTFYMDGEVKVLPVKTGVTIVPGHVYDLTIATSGADAGYVTATVADITLPTGTEVTLVDPAYVVAGSPIILAGACKVFNVTTGIPGTADTIEVGDKIAVAATNTDGAAILVYIVG